MAAGLSQGTVGSGFPGRWSCAQCTRPLWWLGSAADQDSTSPLARVSDGSPLGPGEVFVPGYRVSRTYVNRVNITNTNVNITRVTNV